MRTPFQRDRDRIVHSKPFRRLKGKTQVFIDPDGDHYRTRMTHTLETTAISRVVARALRLNEDLVEAIGLGHDMGHTPFGHAGEDALDDAVAGASAGASATTSSRSGSPARSTSPTRCATGSSPTPASRSRRRSRGRSSDSSTGSRTSTTTSTTRCDTGCSTRRTFPLRRSRCSGRRAPRGSTRWSTTSSRAPTAPAKSASPRRSGTRCSRSAPSCSSASISGPRRARARACARGGPAIFDHLAERGDEPDEIVDYIAGMTDRFALGYAESL